MAVKIGSARSSYGNTKKGDQNGREVSTQTWYLHPKGWRVFRAKDAAKRLLLAKNMENACKNDLIGYSQAQRYTLDQAVCDKGWDPAKCDVACNTDCSELVRVCINGAFGKNVIGKMTTDVLPDRVLGTGLFIELKGEKYTDSSAYLQPGDILCTKTKGHVVIVLTYGSKAEQIDADIVTIAATTWNVRSGPAKTYKVVGTVHEGETYPVLDRDGSGWVKITKGWISPKGVKV